MSDFNTDPTVLSYGTEVFPIADLSERVRFALMSRGLAHVLGNEVAAKVSTAKARAIAPQTEGGEPGAPLSDEQVAQAKAEHFASAVRAIREGTLGVRAPGAGSTRAPVDPIAALTQKMALAEIGTILGKFKDAEGKVLKVPTGDKTIMVGGQTRTRDQLLANHLGKHGTRITAEATKAHKAEQARLAKAAPGTEDDLAAALGI